MERIEGADCLINALMTHLRPRREQQARQLHEAGARQGGMLSRQTAESMAQHVLGRKALYWAMLDVSSERKLPELVLAEHLLQHIESNTDGIFLAKMDARQTV